MRTKVRVALVGTGVLGLAVLAMGVTGQTVPSAPGLPPAPQAQAAPPLPPAPQQPPAPEATPSAGSQMIQAEIAAQTAEAMAKEAAAEGIDAAKEVAAAARAQVRAQLDVQKLANERAQAMAELSEQMAQLKENFGPEEEQALGELKAKLADLGANLQQLGPEMQELQKKVVEMNPENAMWIGEDAEDTGWLGIEISEISADRAKELKLSADRGVEVVGIEPDSPASKAGLREHDAIVTFDGQAVEGRVQFRRLVRETPPGRTVSLGISREGNVQTVKVEIGDRDNEIQKNVKVFTTPPNMGPSVLNMPDFDYHFAGPDMLDMRTPLLGINAEDLDGQLGAYFGAPDGHGVLVREVRKGTPAEKAGLQAGDVITKLDDKPVKSLHDLRADLREKIDQKSVSLSLLRKGSSMTVPVEIEKPRPIETPQVTHRAQL